MQATNWAPLIAICSEQTTGKSSGDDTLATGTTDTIETQCAHVQATVTEELIHTCCSDALCAAMPTSCSRECASVLLPFYRDCSAQIMLSNGALFARLTGLASVCSDKLAGDGH